MTIAILLLLIGCTEPITIKTDHSEPVMVIYGELTGTFKHQEVMVSRSSPYFDDEPNTGISGATVVIQSSDNKLYSFLENDTVKGLYYSKNKFSVQSGITYFLSVEVDFNNDGIPEKYEASTTVLPAVVPDSLSLEPVEMFGHKNHLLYMYFQDPPEENYYLFNVRYNDSLLTNKLSKYEISDDALFKGQQVKGNLYRFDDISNWEKDSEENRKNSIYLKPGDKIDAEVSLISKGYFDFIGQCQQEQSGENPMFGGPASNITTNISNGAVGYFTSYSAARASIEFK